MRVRDRVDVADPEEVQRMRVFQVRPELEDEPDRQHVHGHAEDIGPVDQVQVQAGRWDWRCPRHWTTAGRGDHAAPAAPSPTRQSRRQPACARAVRRQVLVADAPGEHLPARIPLQQLGGDPADRPDHIIGACRCEHDALSRVHRLRQMEHAGWCRPRLNSRSAASAAAGLRIGATPGQVCQWSRSASADPTSPAAVIRQSRVARSGGGSSRRSR